MKKGFTLIEMVVVVIIMGILISIAIPRFQGAIEKSRTSEAMSFLGTLRLAYVNYYNVHGDWVAGFHNASYVDIEGTPKHFGTPTVCCPNCIGSFNEIAFLNRSTNTEFGRYVLSITIDGQIYCSPGAGSPADVCQRLGIEAHP